MKITSLFFTLFLSQVSGVISQSTIIIPFASPVMIDGVFIEGEWNDAYSIPIESKLKLYLKQSDKYLYIGIKVKSPDYQGGWVDLYIAEYADSIINFHSSKKLGDRKLKNGAWEEWEEWWTNKGRWQANYLIEQDKEHSADDLKSEGWEFQIKKTLFHQKELSLMLNVSVRTTNIQKTVFPRHASNLNSKGWFILRR